MKKFRMTKSGMRLARPEDPCLASVGIVLDVKTAGGRDVCGTCGRVE